MKKQADELGMMLAACLIFISLATYTASVFGQTIQGKIGVAGKATWGVFKITGCGAGAGGNDVYDQSTCGNVGNPYATEGGSATGTHIIACNAALTSNVDYVLDNDVTAAGGITGTCFNLPYQGHKLDLGGHTVTGCILQTSNGVEAGTALFNGTINCSRVAGAGTAAAVELAGSGFNYISNPIRIHHLTISNTVANVNSRLFLMDGTPGAGTVGFVLHIYNVTSTPDPCTADPNTICTRVQNFRIQGSGLMSVEWDHNSTTCGATTFNCQGIETFQLPNPTFHDNNVNMAVQTTPGAEGRGIAVDGSDLTASGCTVLNNYITANANRAVRVRSQDNCNVHDNRFASILSAPGNTSAVHICDGNGGSGVTEAYSAGALIQNNTFDMRGGTGMYLRWCTGWTVKNNSIIPLSSPTGNFLLISNPLGTTTITLTKNDVVNSLATSINVSGAGQTVNVCKSGVVSATGGAVYNNLDTTC